MRGRHRWTGSCGVARLALTGGVLVGVMTSGVILGCGQAPPPPSAIPPVQKVGAGSKGQSETDVLTVRPSPDAVMPTPPVDEDEDIAPPPDEPEDEDAEVAPAEVAPDPKPAAAQPAQVFSACHETSIAGCDTLYVRVVKSAPDLCVQLALDNCDLNGRSGLQVAVPVSWRLASGSASTNRGCDLREYDPKSEPVLSASGSVSFTQKGRQVSQLKVDLQLQLTSSSESKVPAQIAVETPAAITDIDDCEQ